MKALSASPSLVEQVHDAILREIACGALPSGARIIQEEVAKTLGVSRQPVQQALALLRKQGALREAPGRGLIVAPLDADQVQHMYEIRAVIEGLAARRAAELNATRAAQQGPALIEAGRKAMLSGSLPRLVGADVKFHQFVYALAANPLIAPAMAPYWTTTQRAMAETFHDEAPRDIWDQHEAILEAIASGDAERAEREARRHIALAADAMVPRLRGEAR